MLRMPQHSLAAVKSLIRIFFVLVVARLLFCLKVKTFIFLLSPLSLSLIRINYSFEFLICFLFFFWLFSKKYEIWSESDGEAMRCDAMRWCKSLIEMKISLMFFFTRFPALNYFIKLERFFFGFYFKFFRPFFFCSWFARELLHTHKQQQYTRFLL